MTMFLLRKPFVVLKESTFLVGPDLLVVCSPPCFSWRSRCEISFGHLFDMQGFVKLTSAQSKLGNYIFYLILNLMLP